MQDKYEPEELKNIQEEIKEFNQFMGKITHDTEDETIFEKLVGYWWWVSGRVTDLYYSIKHGTKNFWIYRKIIWNDRWWDYGFLTALIKFKLELMNKNWKKANYIGKEYDHSDIQYLIYLLNQIEKAEDSMDSEKLAELYEEFGERLFKRRIFEVDTGNQKHKKNMSPITRLWD